MRSGPPPLMPTRPVRPPLPSARLSDLFPPSTSRGRVRRAAPACSATPQPGPSGGRVGEPSAACPATTLETPASDPHAATTAPLPTSPTRMATPGFSGRSATARKNAEARNFVRFSALHVPLSAPFAGFAMRVQGEKSIEISTKATSWHDCASATVVVPAVRLRRLALTGTGSDRYSSGASMRTGMPVVPQRQVSCGQYLRILALRQICPGAGQRFRTHAKAYDCAHFQP
jgi:hypothetical protein